MQIFIESKPINHKILCRVQWLHDLIINVLFYHVCHPLESPKQLPSVSQTPPWWTNSLLINHEMQQKKQTMICHHLVVVTTPKKTSKKS